MEVQEETERDEINKLTAGAFMPKLDLIFTEVENSLPSIDFDHSDASSDEDVAIFQRSVKAPSFDDDKDLDESLSNSTWDQVFQSQLPDNDVAAAEHCRTSTSPFGVDHDTSITAPPSGSNPDSSNASCSATCHVTASRGTSTHTVLSRNEISMDKTLKIDPQGKPEGKDSCDDVSESSMAPTVVPDSKSLTSQEVVSRYISTSGPTLTYQDLDNINLDAVLNQPASGDGDCQPTPGRQTGAVSTMLGSTTGGSPRTAEESEDTTSLIERLAQFSVQQSGASIHDLNPETGAPYRSQKEKPRRHKHKSDLKAEKTAKNIEVEAEQKRRISAVPSHSAVYTAGKSQPRARQNDKPEPATVFIDLRNFDEEKLKQASSLQAVQRVLGLAPLSGDRHENESSSSGEEEEERMLWHEQRRRMKEASRSKAIVTQCQTDIKDGKKEGGMKSDQRVPRTSDGAFNGAQRLAKPQEEPTHTPGGSTGDTLKKQPVSGPVTGSTESPVVTSIQPVTDDVERSVKSAVSPAPAATDQTMRNKEKARRQAREARQARESERQSRIRLSERLEALRPKLSVREKHPAAEATPVIFDLDASYEPAPQCLPASLGGDTTCLLLTVHMACNGEIILHRGNSSRSVDSGEGLSASYTTLLTWILSLVPDDFTFLQSPGGSSTATTTEPARQYVPFKVVALQQMALDDKMALYIAVCPGEAKAQSPSKGRKSKKREDFAAITTKFLTTNTLYSVSPWLQDLVSMEVTSPATADTASSVYRPPLPNISNKPLSTFIQVNAGVEAVQKLFSLSPGFYWHTMENDSTAADVDIHDNGVDYDTQNTMSLIYKKIYREPRCMMGILNRVLQEGLDLAGVRLLYPTEALMTIASAQPAPSDGDMINKIGPVLGLAVRGTYARTLWLDAVGPADPTLARLTDPNSLCALYGGNSRDESLIFCPRNPTRISTELARWFGGRVPASGVVNIGLPRGQQRPGSGGRRSKGQKVVTPDLCTPEIEAPASRPPAMLTATIRSDFLLVISPLVPVKCLGLILATCQRRGYMTRGIRRFRLTTKRANLLGMTGKQMSVFTIGREADLPPISDLTFDLAGGDAPAVPCRPVTVVLLSRENCYHNAAGLVEAFMVQMCLSDLLRSVQSELSEALTSSLLFYTVPHSDALVAVIGGDLSKTPQTELAIAPGYIAPMIHTNPEMEQIVTVTFTGHQVIKNFGLGLGRLLGLVSRSKSRSPPPCGGGFELLGIKWLPSLSAYHAKELTPHEVGDPEWKSSIQALTSEPAVVLVLRGIDAHCRLESILNSRVHSQMSPRSAQVALEKIVAATPEAAYRQMSMFFWDYELFPDPSVRELLPYLPLGKNIGGATESLQRSGGQRSFDLPYEESIFDTMLRGPKPIVTVLVAKPDVVRRSLGKLMKRIAQAGFTVVGARLAMLTATDAAMVTPAEDKENEVLCDMHCTYLTSAPSLILCLQRENAVHKLVELLGPTDPQRARRQGQHLWRATFGSDAIVNGLHCSQDYGSAVEEVHHFFPRGLCCPSNPTLESDLVPSLKEDDVLDLKMTREVTVSDLGRPEEESVGLTRSSGTVRVDWTLPTSSLTQTNCVLLPPLLTKSSTRGRRPAFIDIMDALFSNGFALVGLRMLVFSERQAEQYLCLSNAGSFKLVPMLTSGPSLVLAVQRDNAIMAFDSLLGSVYIKDSVIAKHGEQMMRPKDMKSAHKHLVFFFDHLIPTAQLSIKFPATASLS